MSSDPTTRAGTGKRCGWTQGQTPVTGSGTRMEREGQWAEGGCAGAQNVCLHVPVHVYVAGTVTLQGNMPLSARGHTGGSTFPWVWVEGKMAKAPFIAANCQRLQEKARRFWYASLKSEVLLLHGAGILIGLPGRGRLMKGFTEQQTQVAEVRRMGECGTLSEGSARKSQYTLDKRVT